MYDFWTHFAILIWAIIFAVLGVIALFFILGVLAHEIFVILVNRFNPNNKENDS